MLSGNISRNSGGVLCFAGHDTAKLAEKYGTPLYLMDEGRIRDNCRMYLHAFKDAFGERGKVLYASKAASFKRMYEIVAEEGLSADVVSAGEIRTALKAGFPMDRLYFHGSSKTDSEISYAVASGVGCFVVDNMEELHALNREAGSAGIRQRVLLRVTPGIDPHTYDAVSTGKVDSKFGVAIETGQAKNFVSDALRQENLELRGLHCHVGSQVFDEDVYERTADIMLSFMAELRDSLGVTLEELNLGGGYGVRYLESDKHVDIPARIKALGEHIKALARKLSYPMPVILMEPGRSIVGAAGMTLYTVGSVKRIPGYKNYVSVDGGMADNPRFALYRSQYTCLPADRMEETRELEISLVGRCCESGDIIQEHVPFPATVRRGDLVAVCTTGAYNYSMASNYNRLPRPPIVMLRGGESYIAVRRESYADLCGNDL